MRGEEGGQRVPRERTINEYIKKKIKIKKSKKKIRSRPHLFLHLCLFLSVELQKANLEAQNTQNPGSGTTPGASGASASPSTTTTTASPLASAIPLAQLLSKPGALNALSSLSALGGLTELLGGAAGAAATTLPVQTTGVHRSHKAFTPRLRSPGAPGPTDSGKFKSERAKYNPYWINFDGPIRGDDLFFVQPRPDANHTDESRGDWSSVTSFRIVRYTRERIISNNEKIKQTKRAWEMFREKKRTTTTTMRSRSEFRSSNVVSRRLLRLMNLSDVRGYTVNAICWSACFFRVEMIEGLGKNQKNDENLEKSDHDVHLDDRLICLCVLFPFFFFFSYLYILS